MGENGREERGMVVVGVAKINQARQRGGQRERQRERQKERQSARKRGRDSEGDQASEREKN